jgi:hypothetical protein
MFIQTEATPNPEVLKFLPGRDVLGEGSRDFRSVEEAGASPLAAELFGIEGVERVHFGADFLTVGKGRDQDFNRIDCDNRTIVRISHCRLLFCSATLSARAKFRRHL